MSVLRGLQEFATAQLPIASGAIVSLSTDGGFRWSPVLQNDWWRKGKLWGPIDVVFSSLAGDSAVHASTAYDDGGSLPMDLFAGAGSYKNLQEILAKGPVRVDLHPRGSHPGKFPLTEATVQILAERHGLGFPAPIRKLFTSERLASDSVGLLNPISEGFLIEPDNTVCHILTFLAGDAFLYYEAPPENDGKPTVHLKLYSVDEEDVECFFEEDDDLENFMCEVLKFIEASPPEGHSYSAIRTCIAE